MLVVPVHELLRIVSLEEHTANAGYFLHTDTLTRARYIKNIYLTGDAAGLRIEPPRTLSPG
jgi:hypothetical protein